MRIFEQFPKDATCEICGTNENKQCCLIGIDGTEDGGNMQAKPFHLHCIELTMTTAPKGNSIIYQFYNPITRKAKK